MTRNIITLQVIAEPEVMEHWGSLTELCANHPNFPYHSLKDKKFPFEFKGFRFLKKPYKEYLIVD